ncbi:Lpg1974 family pore-forming outer membrane protein, partial [Chlamydiales bacterium]|nr:Lpg1974 family pore-forming outer membrane protein [Chlamydiales bacterium]
IPLPLPTPNWRSLEIRPDLHFGFDIGLKVLFPGNHTTLQINWERLHASDSTSTEVSSENMVGPYFNIGPDSHPYKRAHGHVKHGFDEVTLSIGSQFDSCRGLKINYTGGVAITRIEETLTSTFSNNDWTVVRGVYTPTEFIGIGPEFGADVSYNLCEGFSLTGESSMALLLGRGRNHTSYASITPELEVFDIPLPNIQHTEVPSRTQFVPAFSGKLGVSYTGCFSSCLVTLDLGYQAQIYLNAVQSVEMSAEVVEPTIIELPANEVGVFALGFRRTVSDFFLAGPYVTLKIAF